MAGESSGVAAVVGGVVDGLRLGEPDAEQHHHADERGDQRRGDPGQRIGGRREMAGEKERDALRHAGPLRNKGFRQAVQFLRGPYRRIQLRRRLTGIVGLTLPALLWIGFVEGKDWRRLPPLLSGCAAATFCLSAVGANPALSAGGKR